jgi:hypothetical protein
MTMNTVSREYTPDYARELLIASLERVNRLRKDTWELKEIFDLDLQDEFLEDLARNIVAKLLDDFSPGNLDSLIMAVKTGSVQLHYSNGLKEDD